MLISWISWTSINSSNSKSLSWTLRMTLMSAYLTGSNFPLKPFLTSTTSKLSKLVIHSKTLFVASTDSHVMLHRKMSLTFITEDRTCWKSAFFESSIYSSLSFWLLLSYCLTGANNSSVSAIDAFFRSALKSSSTILWISLHYAILSLRTLRSESVCKVQSSHTSCSFLSILVISANYSFDNSPFYFISPSLVQSSIDIPNSDLTFDKSGSRSFSIL